MPKILHVCLSKDLPSERLSNYIYFTYDRLNVYYGSDDPISEDFAIVDSMPEQPVNHMVYILTDGTIHQYIDYSDVLIAQVEDPSETELIRKAGTTYFVNGDGKYIDQVKRSIVLPFSNGVYNLVVDAQKDQKYDNNTILKYNEEHGCFEIYGDSAEEYKDYQHELHGRDTVSVHTEVSGSKLLATVILSKAFDNALKVLGDGLYVRSDNKANINDFNQWVKDFKDFRSYAYAILDNLDAQIAYIESFISENAISEEITRQLVAEYPNIDTALDNYDYIRNQLDIIEYEAMKYVTDILDPAIEGIDTRLETASQWEDLDDVSEYTHEVDYYDKATKWYHVLSPLEMQQVITTAIAAYLQAASLDDDGVYNFGDLDDGGWPTAGGNYDYGDEDGDYDPDDPETVVDGDYDFDELAKGYFDDKEDS